MLSARDIVGHPGGEQAAIDAVRASGLRVTGFQVLRDFEGLSGDLHAYKIDIAKSMLTMCHALGSRVLLVLLDDVGARGRRSRRASSRDLQKLAMLAIPFRIDVAFEALSWGRFVSDSPPAWDLVERADRHNLGLAHRLVSTCSRPARRSTRSRTSIRDKVLFVQLADFMWQATPTADERRETARHFRVFPGEGVHSDEIAALMRAARRARLRGRLQLRGVQRRLRAVAARDGGRARSAVGAAG